MRVSVAVEDATDVLDLLFFRSAALWERLTDDEPPGAAACGIPFGPAGCFPFGALPRAAWKPEAAAGLGAGSVKGTPLPASAVTGLEAGFAEDERELPEFGSEALPDDANCCSIELGDAGDDSGEKVLKREVVACVPLLPLR